MGLIRRNWIWILAIVVAVAGFAAFQMTRKTEAEYFTAKVEKGDIRQVIDATTGIAPAFWCVALRRDLGARAHAHTVDARQTGHFLVCA